MAACLFNIVVIGAVTSDLKWDTLQFGGPINLWTFQADFAPECNPTLDIFNSNYPCLNLAAQPQSNVIYIEDSTYEDDIVIDDSATCTIPIRTGTTGDINFGCKVTYSHESTLPPTTKLRRGFVPGH